MVHWRTFSYSLVMACAALLAAATGCAQQPSQAPPGATEASAPPAVELGQPGQPAADEQAP